MKLLVCFFLLLLGIGAQPALACAEDAAGVHRARAVVAERGFPTAIELDRAVGGHHCDCPTRVDGAQAAATASEKFLVDAPARTSAGFADPSYAEPRRALDADSRFRSGSSPASHLPPYLLNARLRC